MVLLALSPGCPPLNKQCSPQRIPPGHRNVSSTPQPPQHLYRATVGQQALRRQAINKSGIIMEPNESPSIFPKQAGDLRVLQEEELLPAFEDEPRDEQKPNVAPTLNTSYCKTRKRTCQPLGCPCELCIWVEREDLLFHYGGGWPGSLCGAVLRSAAVDG